MTLEEIAKMGNEESLQLCRVLLDRLGPGKEYECVVGAAATTFLFHAFRLALPRSKEKAVELLGVILGDVAHNVMETSGDKIKFTVQ